MDINHCEVFLHVVDSGSFSAAAQETGRVTMRMPVSEEVAAAFESTRDGRRASL